MADADPFHGLDFDPRNQAYHQFMNQRSSWPLPTGGDNGVNNDGSNGTMPGSSLQKRSSSPLPIPAVAPHTYPPPSNFPLSAVMRDWQMPPQVPTTTFTLDTAFAPSGFEAYDLPFQASPIDYMSQQTGLNLGMEGGLGAGLSLDGSYVNMANSMGMMAPMHNTMPVTNWERLDYGAQGILDTHQVVPAFFAGSSPADTFLSETHLEVVSLPSSSSDNGYVAIEHLHHTGHIFNPEQTLHPRTFSDSSNSDGEQHSRSSLDGYVDVSHAGSSPSTDGINDSDGSDRGGYYEAERPSPIAIPTSSLPPVAMRPTPSNSPTSRSPTSPQSSRKAAAAAAAAKKPSLVGKTTSKQIARRSPPSAVSNRLESSEKRVGRRKGPLRPDQRKQASEIRKLGACIRCRFLKKTCDKGEPCGGCKPSHARLWLVPCTRIDIKDLGYFLKDWKADYQRHVSLGFSVPNIKGFSEIEIPLFITHGYGHYLPLQAREVYVRDDSCFGVNWVESRLGAATEHEVDTARLSAGIEGVCSAKLSEYLDRHIDHTFEFFVDEHFEGTPFITEILKTAYRFWTREKIPVIRKALKLVLAYNLTQTVCFIKVIGGEDDFLHGMVLDEDSYYKGQVAAPVMINFQVKCALADMWRELQKEILEELSTLYSSVYSRDKLKHWPTIFMLAAILLAIWEEMQFDCHYRVPVSIPIASLYSPTNRHRTKP